jgi:thiol-disulfide isomerase/thioredoxin
MSGRTTVPTFTSFIIIIAFSICAFSQTARAQRRGRVRPPNSLLEVLDKEDRDCVLQSGLDRSVIVRQIQLAKDHTRQILVRGSGLCLCGAQNCGFWIYRIDRNKHELLLKGVGSTKVSAGHAAANGYRDVISESHASAAETIVRTYRYDGSRYQLQRCVNRAAYDDEGRYTRKPVNRPCADDGSSESFIKVPAGILNQELTTIDNRSLRLSDYSNRVIVVNLFAPWCVPCRRNIPDLNILNRNLGKDFQLIGVVARENEPQIDNLRSFIATLNIQFPVVWENMGFTDSLSSLVPGLHVLPQTFIIDKAGRLRRHFPGFNAEVTPALLREALDQVRAKDAIGPP